MLEQITNFLNNNMVFRIFLDAYLIFIVVFVILRFVLRNKKAIGILLFSIVFLVAGILAIWLDLDASKEVYRFLLEVYAIFVVILLAPEIRKALDANNKETKLEFLSSNERTKNEIADAVMFLASRKIGALITIEKHNSLDQYAEKAIQLNSDVSKELLINIFSPLTPLHDGGVIIRGNKIRCAGAYYVLTQHNDLDKTTGSRHRAGLGISEVTDALTVIVSEETGGISITIEGIMLKINDKQKLLEYIDMFLK